MNMEPKTWIITDTHLGHDKMVEYCGRPANHSELILENLEVILPGDTLIHLGDICIGKDAEWHEKLSEILKGVHRILLIGNHDNKSERWYKNHCWDTVADVLSGNYFGRYVTFSHIPVPNAQNLNIHGHFHNNLHRLQRKEWVTPDEEDRNMVLLSSMNNNHKLLAIEYTDYKPILLEDFLSNLTKEK